MAQGYGQYCPLSLASELLTQRWTILIVSRVMAGCARFNAIRRGLPQISPTLLSQRLEELEQVGILQARPSRDGPWREYSLTPAGEDLRPLVDAMALWGQRWARDMSLEDLDPAFLVWSMHTRIDADALPPGRTVVRFGFTGAPSDCRRFWLVCEDGSTDMCLKDPGYDVDLRVESDLRTFVEAWRGFRDFRSEIRAGRIRLNGPAELREGFPDWLQLHVLAGVPRMRSGRERRLCRTTGPRAARRSGGEALP